MIQELKGNIRVFCRVRPLLEEEYTGVPNDSKSFAGNAIRHINFTGDKSLDIVRAAGKYLTVF